MSDPFSPYQSPQMPMPPGAGYSIASADRPVSAIIFGILNLAFAGLSFLGIGFTVLSFLLMDRMWAPNPALKLMQDNEAYSVYMAVSIVLGFIATIVLAVSGIGLLKMRAWGRHLSIGYAVYTIVFTIIGTIANWFWLVGPLLEQANRMPVGPERAGAIGGAIGGLFGGCFGLIYPVVLLIFMLRTSFAQALHERPPAKSSD